MNETSNVFRVFVDSNVLISAMQSETSISRRLLEFVSEYHRLLIAEPDILVTDDLDFHTKKIREYFTVYTPAEFLRYFGYLK